MIAQRGGGTDAPFQPHKLEIAGSTPAPAPIWSGGRGLFGGGSVALDCEPQHCARETRGCLIGVGLACRCNCDGCWSDCGACV